MKLRRKPKSLLKAEERFKSAVTTFIVGLGARPGRCYDFEMDTPAGLLHVSVYEDWVATRFADVERAKVVTKACGYSCNPFSGKWNFHFGLGTAHSIAVSTVLPQLDYIFDRLLHWEAAA